MNGDSWIWIVGGVAVLVWLANRIQLTAPESAPVETMPALVDLSGLELMARAIAFAEGYGVDPNNKPTRSNNPGDLTGAGGIIQTYPTAQDGWDALRFQLQLMANGESSYYDPNFTIAQVASRWTATEQDAWASNVVAYLAAHGYSGVSVDTPLNAIIV